MRAAVALVVFLMACSNGKERGALDAAATRDSGPAADAAIGLDASRAADASDATGSDSMDGAVDGATSASGSGEAGTSSDAAVAVSDGDIADSSFVELDAGASADAQMPTDSDGGSDAAASSLDAASIPDGSAPADAAVRFDSGQAGDSMVPGDSTVPRDAATSDASVGREVAISIGQRPGIQMRVWLAGGTAPGDVVYVRDESEYEPLVQTRGVFGAGPMGGTGNLCTRAGCTIELFPATLCARVFLLNTPYCSSPDSCTNLSTQGTVCPTEVPPLSREIVLEQPFEDAAQLAPLTAFRFHSLVPIRRSSTLVSVYQGDTELGASTLASDWGGTITLYEPIDPEGYRVELRARDVFGEALSVVDRTLRTTASLADPAFETAPTPGSIAVTGGQLIVRNGALRMLDNGGYPRPPFAAYVALDAPAGATSLGISGTQINRGAGGLVTARVLRAGGAVGSTVSISNRPIVATIPAGTGALWLVLQSPQDLPPPNDRFDPNVMQITELQFQ